MSAGGEVELLLVVGGGSANGCLEQVVVVLS